MALTVTAKMVDQVAEITLSGELDASTAPLFQAELVKVAQQKPKRLVLRVGGLAFMASAGVRMLLIAKQKMGTGVDVYVIAPQQEILDTIERVGLGRSVIVQSEYKSA
jgi:anti-anti-sigma factor